MSAAPLPVIGYCDPLSVRPGDDVRFMVSSVGVEEVDAQLVRLWCGDVTPGGHGFDEDEVPSTVDGRHACTEQPLRPGSFAEVAPHAFLASLASFRLEVCAWPTAPGGRRQVLVSTVSTASGDGGLALALDAAGRPTIEVAGPDGPLAVTSGEAVRDRRWVRLVATYDAASGALALRRDPIATGTADDAVVQAWSGSTIGRADPASAGSLLFAAARAADGTTVDHFDGRLDACRLGDGVREARWDFGMDIGTTRITDVGDVGLHGRTHQLPTRAVPGVRWTGDVHDWQRDPSHYGAIHFHADDLADAGWAPTCTLRIPADLESGVYALRLRTNAGEDRIPFFVLPALDAEPAPVAFLAPTVTYRAYANIKLTASPDAVFGSWAEAPVAADAYLLATPAIGPGLYDHHSDGSGCSSSSHLRPVTNLRPGGGLWSFTADTNVTGWLHHTGLAHDVITDDAVHLEGIDLLARYRVLVTGTHPEYWTTPMLDALTAYLAGGGRLLYLGANGFYWRTSFHREQPAAIEVRRAEDGTRFWIAEPGEYVHESTGEFGGLWRRIGHPPNRVCGVGFSAQGFGRSGHYRRTERWDDPRVAFAVAGLSDREILGDHGSIGGGAAGHEIDRYDVRLGSPAHAIVLATSEGLGTDMERTKEEFLATGFAVPGAEVRSDVVFFEGPKGGAVFSTGSIAWAASLATDGYDNDVARLTTNVLRRFADPEPFVPPVSGGP